ASPPPPDAHGGPRSSPTSGERAPSRQQMAAAQVAKRKAALHGRGLMENAFLRAAGPKDCGGRSSGGGGGGLGSPRNHMHATESPSAALGFVEPPSLNDEAAAGGVGSTAGDRRHSGSSIPDHDNPWDAAILNHPEHSNDSAKHRRGSGRAPHKTQGSSHHPHGAGAGGGGAGCGGQRQERTSPAVAVFPRANLENGSAAHSASTGAGAGSNPDLHNNTNQHQHHPHHHHHHQQSAPRLTIEAPPAPMGVRGSRRRRDHGHSGEDSPPPPGARRGGELVTSPGYKELAASKDWDKHEQSSRSLATSAVGSAAGGGGGGGLSPRFLELLSPGRRGGGGGRGGAVGGGAGNAVQGIAAATAASLEAVRGMKMLQSFRAHTGPVWCAEFSRKGQYLATGGADGLVKV
ncbi:unnamed protein product, partial [Sphacelaria rigidula]